MRTLKYIGTFFCVLAFTVEVVSAQILRKPSLEAPVGQLEAREPKGETRSARPHPPQEETAPEYQEGAVELYATAWCGYCRKAREFFQARGVPFVEYDIEADTEAAQRKREIDARPGVPLVVINGNPIHGFAPKAYERALGAH